MEIYVGTIDGLSMVEAIGFKYVLETGSYVGISGGISGKWWWVWRSSVM